MSSQHQLSRISLHTDGETEVQIQPGPPLARISLPTILSGKPAPPQFIFPLPGLRVPQFPSAYPAQPQLRAEIEGGRKIKNIKGTWDKKCNTDILVMWDSYVFMERIIWVGK